MKNITKKTEDVKVKDGYYITFKDRLKAPKNDYKSYPISDIPQKLNVNNLYYQNGFQNIYLQSAIYHPDKPKMPLHWLVFDVESDEHQNILRNTGCAIDLLSVLSENGLTDNLTVSLTGWGYRFIYPYFVPAEYGKAFLEFCLDVERYGVEAALNQKKGFIRLSGYRGHFDQCRKKADLIDRHIHFLADPLELIFGITSGKDYLDRVQGKPDYNQDMNIIPKLLPTSPIPEKWIAFLEPYLQKAIIREGFWTGYPDQKRGGFSEEQISDAVGENLGRIIENEAFGILATLKKCPECNRAGAFVTSSGRLKCWHTSCAAGERDTDGNIIGLSASDWNPELAELLPEIDDSNDEPEPENFFETQTIEVVRKGIEKAIKSDKDYLINVMPGVGKTTTTLQAIAPFCKQQKLLYITPNHKLNGEIERAATELGITVKRLFGRNKDNCERHLECRHVARNGYSVKFVTCIKCERYKEKNCIYFEQFKDDGKPSLWITTHAQAKYIDLQEFGFEMAVIDENPLQTFFKKISNNSDEIRYFRAFGTDLHKNFFDKIQGCADIAFEQHLKNKGDYQKHHRTYSGEAPKGSFWEGKPDIIETAGITPDEIDIVGRNLAVYEQWEGENVVQWQKRLWKDDINIFALKWIWKCLEQNGTAYQNVDVRKSNSIRYITYYKEIPDFTGIRLVCLDATGEKKDLDALLDRNFQVLDGKVPMPNLKTTWLRLKTGKTVVTKWSNAKIRKILQKTVPYLRKTDQRVLVLTFKDIEERVLGILRELLPDECITDSCHFGAGRGLNKWQNFDACICFGWLNVDSKESLDLAQVLHDTEKDRKAFHKRLGRNEVLQGLHRIRPIFGNKNIILIANQWLSELGKPQVMKDCRHGNDEMMEIALKRCRLWIDSFGCIERSVIRALGVCHQRDAQKASRSFTYFKKIQKDKGLGDFGNDTLLKFGKNRRIYNNLIKTLSKEYDLPVIEIRSEGRWLKALGKTESFKQVYEFFGQKFDDVAIRKCENL